jgi:CheY-like chemotaxis protein
LTVLIVEDDSAMRELIKRVLSDLVDIFWECTDGRDALKLYERHRPAWVLMDIRMEHVDGLTATQRITTAWPESRVLVVTSYTDEGWREAAQRAGALGYISKENLLDIRRWLKT